jgi:multidrug efflux system outer membrane protein
VSPPWLQILDRKEKRRSIRHAAALWQCNRCRGLGAFGILLVLLAVGCTVGPNYQQPDPPMPAQWHSAQENGFNGAPVEIVRWWDLFGDSQLQTLVDRAMRANKDLKVAEARVREARAQWRVAGAASWPAVDASGSFARLHQSENAPSSAGSIICIKPASMPVGKSIFSAGFGAPWKRPSPRSKPRRRTGGMSW